MDKEYILELNQACLDYECDRIQVNFKKVLEDEGYKVLNEKFTKKCRKLKNKLNYKDKLLLEDIKELINDLNSYEVHLAYRIGFFDALELRREILDNK